MNVQIITSSTHGKLLFKWGRHCQSLALLTARSAALSCTCSRRQCGSERPLNMPWESVGWTEVMLCPVLSLSGDRKGLLCCPDMAKVKFLSTLKLISQCFYLESLPFLKLPTTYIRSCHMYFRNDLFWKNVGLRRFVE